MYVHQKLLLNRVYKHFITGKFSTNVPEIYVQLVAISDSFIDLYLISPKMSITLVSTSDLSFPILSSASLFCEKNLLLISIESTNFQIELILLEFNELTEIFQMKSNFSFEEKNKNKSPLEYQGLNLYVNKHKIVAAGRQNYIGVLVYEPNFNQILYEEEISLVGFYGDISFDETGKYFYVLCNTNDDNKNIIYKTLTRIEFYKYEKKMEEKVCVAENSDQLVFKNICVSPELFCFINGENAKLETINFDKNNQNEKNNKKEINKIILTESSITNLQIFDEYFLIGFDDGNIMIYNRFKIQKNLAGNHSYHFKQLSDVLFYEMWFEKLELYCLVCSTKDIRVYSLDYEKNQAGELIIKEEFKENSVIKKRLLNGVIDSTLMKEGESSRFVCLCENRFGLNEELFLKFIDFGVKPFELLRFELKLGNEMKECREFKVFVRNQELLMIFFMNEQIKMFNFMEKNNSIREIQTHEFVKGINFGNLIDCFQINNELFCFINHETISFVKINEDFSKNSMILEKKINSKKHLFKKLIAFDDNLFIAFIEENKKLVLLDFKIEKDKIVFQGNFEKNFENRDQFENLFLFTTGNQNLSIIITYFNHESEIIDFLNKDKNLNGIFMPFFPEISIYSIESLNINSEIMVFISSYSSELYVIIKSTENSYKIIKKWIFNSNFPFKLEPRNLKTLYFHSLFETYIIESYEETIICAKILFEIEKQPFHILNIDSSDIEICLKGNEISFYNIKSDHKKQLIIEVHDLPIKIGLENPGKIMIISKGSPTKKKTIKINNYYKLKRLTYSEKNKFLIIVSENLWLLIFDTFLYKILGTFDLKQHFYKKVSGQNSLTMLKLIKFPNDSELLCTVSTSNNVSEISEMELEETKQENEIEFRINFCEIVSGNHISLQEFTYEIKFSCDKFIKKQNPIMDIIFLFDLEVFVIAVGGVLEVYAFEIQAGENINFNFNMVLQYKLGKKIICLDLADKNMILAGDSSKSLYVLRLEKTLTSADKFIYKFNLIRAEKEQRNLSVGRIIDPETVIGIDKNGDCFISKLNDDNYLDCNTNTVNYAVNSFRDSSRNLHFLNQKFNFARQVNINGKLNEKHKENSRYLLFTSLLGGLYQIKSINLVYLFDNEEINGFVERFTVFLMEQKSLKFSHNKNDLMNFCSAFKPSQKFIDFSIINEFVHENEIIQKKIVGLFISNTSSKMIEFSFEEIMAALKELLILF